MIVSAIKLGLMASDRILLITPKLCDGHLACTRGSPPAMSTCEAMPVAAPRAGP